MPHTVGGGFAVRGGGVVHVHSRIHSVLLVGWIIGLVRYVIGLIQRGAIVDDDGRLVRRVGCGGAVMLAALADSADPADSTSAVLLPERRDHRQHPR